MSVATLLPIDLKYFQPPTDGSRPYILATAAQNGERAANWEPKSFPAKVENVRGHEDEYTLDKTGFEFHKSPTSLKADDFSDDATIERTYYDETIATIKRLTGASRVVIFDHTVRRNDPNHASDKQFTRKAVDQVHVDQTPSAAARRVERHLPAEEVPKLLKGRYQIINLWRPIRHEAYDRPLAVCDYRSLDVKNDLVPSTLRYPNYDGETFNVRYNPDHRWKYWKGMTPDELILIKCADSITDGSVAVCTPHTSFEDPTKPANAKFRESIEVRTLVFYD